MSRYHFNVLLALGCSVLLHLGGLMAYEGRRWSPAASRGGPAPEIPTISFFEEPEPDIPEFMETYEHQAQPAEDEAVPDTPYYGVRSTLAANPENAAEEPGVLPYVDGGETRVLNAESVALGGPETPPALSDFPPPEPVPEMASEKTVVDDQPTVPDATRLAMLNEPALPPPPPLPPVPAPAPRIPNPLREGGDFATVKGKQQSVSVGRRGRVSFDVMGVEFAEYDREMFKAVQKQWYDLVDRAPNWRPGIVRLSFGLYEDGHVGNVRRVAHSTGEVQVMWCQKAIDQAGPFGPVPDELRELMQGGPREITVTFYY